MPPKRPAAVAVGDLHAFPMRAPLAGRRDWYWRVYLHRDGRQVLDQLLAQPGAPEVRLLTVAAKTVEMIARYLDPACARAGLPRWTLYGLRRLASSTLIESGIDPVTYAAQMGHSWEMGLRLYARTKPSAVRSAADMLGVAGGGSERWQGKKKA